jgi:hypothetical protein
VIALGAGDHAMSRRVMHLGTRNVSLAHDASRYVYDWLLAGMSEAKSALKSAVLLVFRIASRMMDGIQLRNCVVENLRRSWFASSD